MLAHHAWSQLAGSTGSSHSSGSNYSLLFLVAIFALVYFLFIAPQRKKQRKALEQRRQIAVGDEVVTTAGLIARVVDLDDDTVVLEIAPGVQARFLRQAIVRTVEEPGADGGEEPEAPAANDADDQKGSDPATEPAGSN